MTKNTCPVVVEGTPCESGQRIVLGLCLYHYKQRKRGASFTTWRKRKDQGSSALRDDCGRKRCQRCDKWLPVESYSTHKSTPDGLQRWCSQCAADHRSLERYGMTRADVEAMAQRQGGCAMCGVARPRHEGHRNGWHVDHDHACCPGGVACERCIRGVLCAQCNKLIGLVDDDVDRLVAAIRYLRRHGKGGDPRG